MGQFSARTFLPLIAKFMNIQTFIRSFTAYVHDFTTKNYYEDYLTIPQTHQRILGHNRSYQGPDPELCEFTEVS